MLKLYKENQKVLKFHQQFTYDLVIPLQPHPVYKHTCHDQFYIVHEEQTNLQARYSTYSMQFTCAPKDIWVMGNTDKNFIKTTQQHHSRINFSKRYEVSYTATRWKIKGYHLAF